MSDVSANLIQYISLWYDLTLVTVLPSVWWLTQTLSITFRTFITHSIFTVTHCTQRGSF